MAKKASRFLILKYLSENRNRLQRELSLERKFGRSVEIGSEKYLKPYYKTEILREAVYA